MNKLKLFLFNALIILLLPSPGRGQVYDTLKIKFGVNEWRINNIEEAFNVEKYGRIKSILFNGDASPDGPEGWNTTLSLLRAIHTQRAICDIAEIHEYKIGSIFKGNIKTERSEYPELRSVTLIIQHHATNTITPRKGVQSAEICEIGKIPVRHIKSLNQQYPQHRQPMISIGTNLMYDIMGAPDLNIEYYPANGFWCFGSEATIPWFKQNEKHQYFQLQRYRLYAKYYPRTPKSYTRWHISPYIEWGVYDFEKRAGWIRFTREDDKGYQGEHYGFGIGGGYTLKSERVPRLRVDFSAALGYIGTKYREYIAVGDLYPHINNGKTNYLGPTHIGATLMWEIVLRKDKGRYE